MIQARRLLQAQRFPGLKSMLPLVPMAVAGVVWRSPVALIGIVWLLVRAKVATLDARERFRLRRAWRDWTIGLLANAFVFWIVGRAIYQLITGS